MTSTTRIPVIRRYDQQHLRTIALPLGGIGTGTVSLGGRGDLRDWEIGNRPAKKFRPDTAFVALRVCAPGGTPTLIALEGPLEADEYQGAYGSPAAHHGLPRFRNCTFEAAYPFGMVHLSDPAVPVSVTIEGFNPLIPPNASDSGIPMAALTYHIHNHSDTPLTVDVVASIQNHLGTIYMPGGYSASIVNDFFQISDEEKAKRRNTIDYVTATNIHALRYTPSTSVRGSEADGSMVLALIGANDVTHRTGWADYTWGDSLLDFWDDLRADGRLDARSSTALKPIGSLAQHTQVAPHADVRVTFMLTWHFPNRVAWRSEEYGAMHFGEYTDTIIGNEYTTRYRDAWDVVVQTAPRLQDLRAQTLEFVTALAESSLPQPIIEAALFNLSTLRSQTTFRTPDGRLFGWEGTDDARGSCFGTCTHVWNYEQATAFLFGALAKTMRENEFLYATRPDGQMSFRIGLPLSIAQAWPTAAADGQMGCIVKLYRDWRLSGDTQWLTQLYPHAKAALMFAWVPNGWDGDRDGVMEGCQHNTMDVEYYGPNPQMTIWYLAALRASARMARAMHDHDFADECVRLYKNGSAWVEANLFNGEYYRHEIRPPMSAANIAPGIRHMVMGASNFTDPELQLGDGCLVDQLVGQYLAHISGIGDLTSAEQQRTTLASIYKYNRQVGFHHHFNHMRSFVLGDESALLMASYPHGNRPQRPFPYFTEVMTGFEYTAAAGMIYSGLRDEAVQVVSDIRARYDGAKRSPFDEAECGHHYARAMASFGLIMAWTGQQYDARTGELSFGAMAAESSLFWATGYAWGTLSYRRDTYTLTVLAGELQLATLKVGADELCRYGVIQSIGRSALQFQG
ncbi:MAG: non-lysosomal glucosylceramidase [Chloroflexaceae bacterium]|nr:non-lysosomal glucosylceramidase [Chloroflexaceae bacterium]